LFNRFSGIDNSISNNTVEGSYYYFSRLTEEQKKIYKELLAGIRACKKEIKMPIRPINEISMIFSFILLDNPILFYVSTFSMSSDLYKKKCAIAPEYNYARSEINESKNKIMKHLAMFDTIMNKRNDEKELIVHDYCLDNFSYDYSFSDYSYSVLGPVLSKKAVCEGIAKFAKLAFDYLGVKSLVVSGKAKNPAQDSKMEGHSWNIVKINGKTYHLDVTFDMTVKNQANRYDYFNLSDDEIKKDHVIINDVPTCSTTGNDYYSANSLTISSIAELDNYIGKALRQGKRSILVKIANEKYTDAAVNRVMVIAQRQYSRIHTGGTMVETSYNSSQMVFEIDFK